MSGRFSRRRVPLLMVLVLVGALTPAGPALGVTKSQVDRACSTSAGAYDAYLSAKAEFQAAADAYEAALIEVENVLYRQERAAETLEIRQSDMEVAKERFEQQAVEAYMNGGQCQSCLVLHGVVPRRGDHQHRVPVVGRFRRAAISPAISPRSRESWGCCRDSWWSLEQDLREVEAERLEAKDAQEQAMLADQAAWEKLSGECANLQKQFEIEVARAAAARGGGAGGVSSAATPGFRCPFPWFVVHRLVGCPPLGWAGPQGHRHDGAIRGPPVCRRERDRLHRQQRARGPDRMGGGRLRGRLLLRPPLRLTTFPAGRGCR